jgi:hypothetical protein
MIKNVILCLVGAGVICGVGIGLAKCLKNRKIKRYIGEHGKIVVERTGEEFFL